MMSLWLLSLFHFLTHSSPAQQNKLTITPDSQIPDSATQPPNHLHRPPEPSNMAEWKCPNRITAFDAQFTRSCAKCPDSWLSFDSPIYWFINICTCITFVCNVAVILICRAMIRESSKQRLPEERRVVRSEYEPVRKKMIVSSPWPSFSRSC